MATTIKDVAALAGVAPSTVSRVINNSGYVKAETQKKVMDAVRALHFAPNASAQNLASNKTKSIAVVLSDITNPFYSDVIRGITNALNETVYDLILFDCSESIEKEIRALESSLRNRVCGLIYSPIAENNEKIFTIISSIKQSGVPIVLVDRDIKPFSFDSVFVDSFYGAYEATKALLEAGHRDIAIIAGPLDSLPGRERLEGYLSAHEDAGIVADKRLRFLGNFKFESGRDIAERILKMEPRPTAIFSSNNLMTMGCLKTLVHFGIRIPEDIALVGFDELDRWNVFESNLSVVARPTEEMGTLVINMLLQRIKDAEFSYDRYVPWEVVLPTELKLNGSEKCCR